VRNLLRGREALDKRSASVKMEPFHGVSAVLHRLIFADENRFRDGQDMSSEYRQNFRRRKFSETGYVLRVSGLCPDQGVLFTVHPDGGATKHILSLDWGGVWGFGAGPKPVTAFTLCILA